jgi:hypothetical protein
MQRHMDTEEREDGNLREDGYAIAEQDVGNALNE